MESNSWAGSQWLQMRFRTNPIPGVESVDFSIILRCVCPSAMTVNPLQAQPIPQRNWNHHREPSPVVDQEYLCNPIQVAKIERPGNAIGAGYYAAPNQQHRCFSCFDARKSQKDPYRHIIGLIHFTAFLFFLL